MKRLVVHIGSSKAASSSIQRTLSLEPLLGSNSDESLTARYWVTGPDTSFPYPASEHSEDFTYAASTLKISRIPGCIHQKFAHILALIPENEIAVISNEGFGAAFSSSLNRGDSTCNCNDPVPVDIVLVVRNVAQCLFSGWLQWWYWMEHKPSFLDTVSVANITFLWDKQLEDLEKSGVEKILVTHVNQGPLEGISRALDNQGIVHQLRSPDKQHSINIAASLETVQLENYVPGMRTVHNSRFEFILERLTKTLELPHTKIPFALTQSEYDQVVKVYEPTIIGLRKYCETTVYQILSTEFTNLNHWIRPVDSPEIILRNQMNQTPTDQYLALVAEPLMKYGLNVWKTGD